jgi:hypothetical protein
MLIRAADYHTDRARFFCGVSWMKSNSLTPAESRKYVALKQAMRQGVMAWAEAVYEIKVGKLWQDEYKTFDDFIESESDYSRSRVYQLLEAVEGQRKLSTSTNVDIAEPVNSTVARAVAKVPEEHVAAVMDKATEGGTKPATAAAVKRVAAEIVPETAPEPSKRERDLEAFRKAKSAAKQHNGAMVRFIDTMQGLRMNPGLHRKALQHFEALDKIFSEWSE